MSASPTGWKDVQMKEGETHAQLKWYAGVTSLEEECGFEVQIGRREIDAVGFSSASQLNPAEDYYHGICYPIIDTNVGILERRVKAALRHGFYIRPIFANEPSELPEELQDFMVDPSSYSFRHRATQYGDIYLGEQIGFKNFEFPVNSVGEMTPERRCGYNVEVDENGIIEGSGWKIAPLSTGEYYVGKFMFGDDIRHVFCTKPDGGRWKISKHRHPYGSPLPEETVQELISERTVYRKGPMAGVSPRNCRKGSLSAVEKTQKHSQIER